MTMNPMKLMKLKGSFDTFTAEHPQCVSFLQAVYPNGIREGSVLEISVTTPEGKPLRYRMTVTPSDMALFRDLAELAK